MSHHACTSLHTDETLTSCCRRRPHHPPQAAKAARPTEKERQQGVDFDDMEKKGKAAAYHAKTGRLQAEGREKVDGVVEGVKQVPFAFFRVPAFAGRRLMCPKTLCTVL
jgi:hypothetical protein